MSARKLFRALAVTCALAFSAANDAYAGGDGLTYPPPSALGTASATSLALGGCSIGTNALCTTGTANISGAATIGGALTYGGVTLSNSVTGTGSMVLATSPTLVTPALGAATGTSLALGGATLGTNALAITGTVAQGGSLPAGFSFLMQSSTSQQLGIVGNSSSGIRLNAAAATAVIEFVDNSLVTSYQPGQINGSTLALGISGTAKLSINAAGLTTLSGGLVSSGALSSINASSNFETDINTGTSSGAIKIGNSGTTGVTSLLGLSTGTNADFLCLSAGGVVLLQTSACTISSARFKIPMGVLTEDALDAIAKLPVVKFRLKPDRDQRDPNARLPRAGLYAEDVAKIMPLCAVYENDLKTPKSYDDKCLIGYLVRGEQQEQREIGHLWLALIITIMVTSAVSAALVTRRRR